MFPSEQNSPHFRITAPGHTYSVGTTHITPRSKKWFSGDKKKKKNLILFRYKTQINTQCCSHTFRETHSLRRTMQIVECSLLHRRAQGSLLFTKDPDQFL